MLEGIDIVVGQDFGELVAAVQWQDGVERIELVERLSTASLGTAGKERFAMRVAPKSGSRQADAAAIYPDANHSEAQDAPLSILDLPARIEHSFR